jgi:hypothetical protein
VQPRVATENHGVPRSRHSGGSCGGAVPKHRPDERIVEESAADTTVADDVKVTTKKNPPSMMHRKIKTERSNDNTEDLYWSDEEDDKFPQKSCLCPSKWICPMIIIAIYVFGMVRIVGAVCQYIGSSSSKKQ